MRESLYKRKVHQNEMDLPTQLIKINEQPVRKYPLIQEVDDEYIELATIVDSLKLTQGASLEIRPNQLSPIKKILTEKLGLSLHLHKIKGCNVQVKISQCRENADRFYTYGKVALNLIKLLSVILGEKTRPKTLDNNSNHLSNPSGYRYGQQINTQILPLVDYISNELNQLFGEVAEEALGLCKETLPFSSPTIKHLELCINLKTDSRSSTVFNRIVRVCLRKFDSISIGRMKQSGALKWAKFEIEKGLYLCIYFKTDNDLRIEYKLENEHIKEFYKAEGHSYLSISKFIEIHRENAIRLFKEILLGKEEYKKGLPASESEKELRALINGKFYTSLMRKITEGDGHFTVVSKDQALYKEVRRLRDLNVFVKEKRQSHYSLHPRFISLIEEDGITHRTFKDF